MQIRGATINPSPTFTDRKSKKNEHIPTVFTVTCLILITCLILAFYK